MWPTFWDIHFNYSEIIKYNWKSYNTNKNQQYKKKKKSYNAIENLLLNSNKIYTSGIKSNLATFNIL